MKRMLVVILFVFCVTGLWAQNKPEKKIQALIITGQSNHKWREATPYLRDRLEETGRFEVRVVEEFRGAGPETLAPYDVVVLNYSDWKKPGLRWGDRAENALLDYVRNGKGLVVYHFAASAFDGWPEYEKLIGGAWRAKSGHSKAHDFKVDIKDSEHPLTKGLPASFPHYGDELYANLVWQPNVHVLATAYDDPSLPKGTGKDQPMLWTLSYGSGRVFGTALGHDVNAMKDPGFIVTFQRGCEWAATGHVTIPIPSALAASPAAGEPATKK